jgi:small subunit ribosomal protein S17
MADQEKNINVKKRSITLTGVVVSAKAEKTISVSVERIFKHQVYKKIVKRRKKYLAHDENRRCKPGDVVKVKLVRPISKRKRWLVVDVISTAPDKEAMPGAKEVSK